MSKKANPTIIGAFVILALVIALGAILALGSGRLFRESTQYALYFNGDLSGLDVGAPVTYNGVYIGQVKSISLIYNHATSEFSIPVIIEILRDAFIEINIEQSGKTHNQMAHHIKQGLRARLAPLNLVTGKLKIDMSQFPETEEVYRATDSHYEEIPTIPGALDSLLQRINDLPLDEIVVDLRDSINGISEVINSGALTEIVAELTETVKTISDVVSSKEVSGAIRSLEAGLQETRATIHEFRLGSKPIRRELATALEEFARAAKLAQSFLDTIDRHPESLLRGKKSNQ